MIFLVCFAGNDNENRKHLFIEIYGRCRPYKLSVQCRPYKKNPMLKEFGLYNRNCTCTLVNFGLFQRLKDKLIWKFTQNRSFSVKTGYHYIMEHLMDNSEYRVEGNWRKLRGLEIPQRMKVFLCRTKLKVVYNIGQTPTNKRKLCGRVCLLYRKLLACLNFFHCSLPCEYMQ